MKTIVKKTYTNPSSEVVLIQNQQSLLVALIIHLALMAVIIMVMMAMRSVTKRNSTL